MRLNADAKCRVQGDLQQESPMRILVLTNLYPPHGLGGYEERCKVTVDELRMRGHEVVVLTSRYGVQDDQSVSEEGVHRLLTPVGFFGFPWVRAPQLFDIERSNHVALSNVAESFHPDVIHVWNMGGIGKDLLHRAHELAPLVSDISDHWVIRGIPSDPLRAWYGRHPPLAQPGSAPTTGCPALQLVNQDLVRPTSPVVICVMQRLRPTIPN